MCVGCWVLGECNLTGVLVDAPVFLYLMAFLGLFTMAIPILKFGCAMLDLRRDSRRLLHGMALTLEICTGAAILLQLSGIAAFSKTMYLFHILDPLALCLCGFCILREVVRCRSRMARRFLLPVAVIALFSLLEVANYYLFDWDVQKSFFFQIGVVTALTHGVHPLW